MGKKNQITIAKAIRMKGELEETVLDLLSNFERKTGLRIDEIRFQSAHSPMFRGELVTSYIDIKVELPDGGKEAFGRERCATC